MDKDVEKLQTENSRLKAALKELTVEKNLREYRLFRAFTNLLKTKKRKIKRLERSVKRLKGVDVIDDAEIGNHHCDTCRCKNRNRQKRGATVVELEGSRSNPAATEDQQDDSDATIDPGSDYGSETELDDEPPSRKNEIGNVSSTANCTRNNDVTDKANQEDHHDLVANDEKDNSQTIHKKSNTPCNKVAEGSKPNSQSDYEMEDLVNELCS